MLSVPRIWSMLPIATPAAMAALASSTRPAPYTGCRMIPSYLPDATASWSSLTCVPGSRLPSMTVSLALPAAAAACAAASIGAS